MRHRRAEIRAAIRPAAVAAEGGAARAVEGDRVVRRGELARVTDP